MTNSEIITKIKSEIRNRLMKKVKEADLYYGQSSKSDTIEGEMIAYADMLSFVSGLKENDSWKPSEDEERLINTSISFLKDFADKGYENAVECIDWLKSLRPNKQY